MSHCIPPQGANLCLNHNTFGSDVDENVSLYLKCNGTEGSQIFPDESKLRQTITVGGDAIIINTDSVFGGGSLSFGGNGYLSIPYCEELDFGTGDFALSCWIKFADISSAQAVIDFRTSADKSSVALGIYQNTLNWIVNNCTIIAETDFVSNIDDWYYIVISRKSGTTKLYRNGTELKSVADVNAYSPSVAGPILIGRNYFNTNNFSGYLDEILIEKTSLDGTQVPTTERW